MRLVGSHQLVLILNLITTGKLSLQVDRLGGGAQWLRQSHLDGIDHQRSSIRPPPIATPLDGPGRRDSGVKPSQDLSANILERPVDSFSKKGIQ